VRDRLRRRQARPGRAADRSPPSRRTPPVGTAQWVTEHFARHRVQRKRSAAAHPADAPPSTSSATPETGRPASGRVRRNFTDDAWTAGENVIHHRKARRCGRLRTDFDQLWAAAAIAVRRALRRHRTAGAGSSAGTSAPGRAGRSTSHRRPGLRPQPCAHRRHAWSSPHTSARRAQQKAIDRGVPVTGSNDGGQMDPIVRGWQANRTTPPSSPRAEGVPAPRGQALRCPTPRPARTTSCTSRSWSATTPSPPAATTSPPTPNATTRTRRSPERACGPLPAGRPPVVLCSAPWPARSPSPRICSAPR